MMTGMAPSELDGTNGSDPSQSKVCILGLEIHNQLAHHIRQRPMMVLSLGLGGPKETDHAVRIKSVGGSTQATFCQAGFLRSFCWWHPKQRDRTNPFIQTLFRCPTPLEEQMIVVGSFSAFSLRFWHAHAPRRGQRRGEKESPLPHEYLQL